jgi:hypothetical protein
VPEEHFLDEKLVELTDIPGFLGEDSSPDGLELRLEELAARFMPPLYRNLLSAGITLPQ